MNYANVGVIDLRDLIDGPISVFTLEGVRVVSFYLAEIQVGAPLFRRTRPDFIDCLTLASALHVADLFLTIDAELVEKASERWGDHLEEVNPGFRVVHWDEFGV